MYIYTEMGSNALKVTHYCNPIYLLLQKNELDYGFP